MAIHDILTVPNPMLKRVSTPVTRVDARVRALMDDMLESMHAAGGIGLAAVQIGVPERVIVMDLPRGDQPVQPVMLANPEILTRSGQLIPYEEGCLSVPDIFDTVARPDAVRLRYLNHEDRLIEQDADGMFAVCVQHEMDHLDGVLFIDYLSRLKRERAVQKVKKAGAREAVIL